jgi:hypothetical protein
MNGEKDRVNGDKEKYKILGVKVTPCFTRASV